jgi:hypothetical protein
MSGGKNTDEKLGPHEKRIRAGSLESNYNNVKAFRRKKRRCNVIVPVTRWRNSSNIREWLVFMLHKGCLSVKCCGNRYNLPNQTDPLPVMRNSLMRHDTNSATSEISPQFARSIHHPSARGSLYLPSYVRNTVILI